MFYTTDQIILLIKENAKSNPGFKRWNNTLLFDWEYNILIQIGAITPEAIKRDYPVLKIKKGENETSKDLGGDLNLLKQKQSELDKSIPNAKIWIEYTPMSYIRFTEAKKILNGEEVRREYAKTINTPPIEEENITLNNIKF